MATIVLSVGNLSRNATIPTGHLNRLLDAMRDNYGQVDDGAGGARDRTDQEVFDIWADGTIQSLRDVAVRSEGDKAAKQAREAVTPIDIT